MNEPIPQRLDRLEAGQERLEAGQERLEVAQERLEVAQERLEVGLRDNTARLERVEAAQHEHTASSRRIEGHLASSAKLFELMHARLEHLEDGQSTMVKGLHTVVERLDRFVVATNRDRTEWAARLGALEYRVDELEDTGRDEPEE